MSWKTNRLLERKHCPLFRQRLQPLIKYYKLLTSMIISFQSSGITVKKFLTPPEEESESTETFRQDTAIDSGCFQNVCKRLGCQHCWESFTDDEFVEAVREERKDRKRKIRAGSRAKRSRDTE